MNTERKITWKREDYLKGKCTHEEYYGQFTNENIHSCILQTIGKKAILESKDSSFNDIPLYIWDRTGIPYGIKDLLHKANETYTLSVKVCILKQAAKEIKERYRK